MADLTQALSGAPDARDLAAVRANAEVGYYAGKTDDLVKDLQGMYPEGHEAHGSADLQRLVEAADDGEFDADQEMRAAAHAQAEAAARATHPDHPDDAPVDSEPDVGGASDPVSESAPTSPAAPTP